LSCIVQKFGGTSVANLDRIKNVAEIVSRARSKYSGIVVVVSAMAGVTNKFVEYVNDMGCFEGDSEYDSVVSSGELVTSGLTAIALRNIGVKSRSYSSWQIPIFTDDNHGKAVIQSIDPANLQRDLENGITPVVCGFQGISSENKVTTLGRGGSDLTAVAVAAALKSDLCEIYSDVDGVYTVDPNLYPEAKKIDSICYREMLEMASQGAKVLQEQSVAYAMKKNVVIRAASSFIDNGGTTISSIAPSYPFCGMAVTRNLSQIKVIYKEEKNFSELLGILEKNLIHAEVLKNNGSCKVDIMIDNKRTAETINILENCDFVIKVKQKIVRRNFSKISVIGSSVCDDVSNALIKELKGKKIDTFGCLTNEYRANLIISSDQLLDAVSVLHKYCGLDK